jgi:NADPH-dependent 2,4-dienoyl-CoA reductase/sulfur reductase-like enzyme/pSer/pThr/pTyr-binding forkhead associated (FHA) protein
MAPRRYLIIGDGAAGTSAAQHVRQADPDGLIAIYSDDPHPAYFRAALTNYLLGELTEDQLWAVPPNFYHDYQVHRALARVAGVDARRALVYLASGGPPIPYDALLVATGSRARPPPFQGGDLPGVMTMRTLQDARDMMDQFRAGSVARAVVVGGGPLGLEWVQALQLRGVQVTLVLREKKFMPGALDEVASDLLLARLRQAGIEVGLADEIQAALPASGGRLGAVVTKSGHTLPCELVGVAIGVVCNTDFLANSGVSLGASRGVVVDERLRASIPGVYAAGDVAEHAGRTLQLWEPAREQARVAGCNMAGGDVAYRPGAHYFATRLYDLDFASVGSIASDASAEAIVDFPRRTGRISYRKVVIKNGRLVGALMLGEREERVRQRGRAFKRLIDGGIEIGAIRDRLLDPTFDLTGWLRTKSLLARPATGATAARPAASPANMRKTHAIQMASPGAAGAPRSAPAPGANGTTAPPELGHLDGPGRRFPLGAPVVSIGRDPSGQVHLDDPGVSFLHAQITRHENDLYLRDLGSRNGTWVNRTQVTLPHLLRSGDRIQLGQTELVFRSAGAASLASSGGAALPSMSPAAGALPHLEIRSGHAVGIAFALTDASATVGRDPSSAIRLDDLSVSSRHAVLRQRGGAWFIADAASTNGTFVRGERLAPERERQLAEGDAVQFGQVAAVFTSRAVPEARISNWYSHSPALPAHTPAPPAARRCVSCGQPLAEGARFCTSCGFRTGGAS